MARLNDAPAPATMDANELLRRKYFRQNKEIARVNQAQSVRIRNLENEISRLLSENLNLREQLIRQQSEMDQVCDVKSELGVRLQELVSLVSRFGQQPPRQRRIPQDKTVQKSLAKSPDQRNWKNTYSLSEAMGAQEGRLPSILEDEAKIARRLEEEELDAIILDAANDTADSPDIGPPPVSQFINEDPVKIDLLKGSVTDDGLPGFDLAHSVNLEQRKKRKDVSGNPEHRRPGRFEPQTQSTREVTNSLKVGAKRKLHVRDDEDSGTKSAPTELSPGDFTYTRRAAEDHPEVKSQAVGEAASREMAVARSKSRESMASSALTSRKALVPKSVNSDVTSSPRKTGKLQALEEISAAKEIAANDAVKEILPDGPTTVMLLKPYTKPRTIIATEQPAPETPAPQNLFSPSSGPSTARPKSRDTPPPSDLGPGMEGQRPNRRARASVSYVEPNLRDKMRRPTKELVDAVTAEGKSQRNSFIKVEDDTNSVRDVKKEPVLDDGWKSMPAASSVNVYATSPLVDKIAALSSEHISTLPHRRRRSSQLYNSSDDEMRSGSGSVISALLAGARKVKEESKELEQSGTALDKAMAHLDIYEFSSSSPREESSPTISTVKEDHDSTRKSGRPAGLPQENAAASGGGADKHYLHRSSSTLSKRKQSSAGQDGSNLNVEGEGQMLGDMGLKRLNPASSHVNATENMSRNERAGARRRSMM